MTAKAIAAKTWSGGEQVTDAKVYSMFGEVVPSSSPTRYTMNFSTGLSAAECASGAGLVIASSTAPSDTKNIWFDTTLSMLRIYDGSKWQPVNGIILTNESGGTTVPGDIAHIKTSSPAANSFTIISALNGVKPLGIIKEAVANGAECVIQTYGKSKVNLDSAGTVGMAFGTSTTTGKGTPSNTPAQGQMGMLLASGTSLVDCLLFGQPSP